MQGVLRCGGAAACLVTCSAVLPHAPCNTAAHTASLWLAGPNLRLLPPCRALGQLTRLAILTLTDPVNNESPIESSAPASDPSLLPVLSIRTLVLCATDKPCARLGIHSRTLNDLIQTSRPHPTAAPVAIHPGSAFDLPVGCYASQCGDEGWMASLLACSDPAMSLHFIALSDRDLRLLAKHLPMYKSALWLTLHGSFDPEVLGATLAAYSGERVSILMDDVASPKWVCALPKQDITDAHVTAMMPAFSRLASLKLAGCPLLTDTSLIEVLEAMGARLTELRLEGLTRVTDASMLALFRNCRNLRSLNVSGLPKVTAAGVAPMVRFQPPGGLRATFQDTGVLRYTLEAELWRLGGGVQFPSDIIVVPQQGYRSLTRSLTRSPSPL